jgi:hypothetical protein
MKRTFYLTSVAQIEAEMARFVWHRHSCRCLLSMRRTHQHRQECPCHMFFCNRILVNRHRFAAAGS